MATPPPTRDSLWFSTKEYPGSLYKSQSHSFSHVSVKPTTVKTWSSSSKKDLNFEIFFFILLMLRWHREKVFFAFDLLIMSLNKILGNSCSIYFDSLHYRNWNALENVVCVIASISSRPQWVKLIGLVGVSVRGFHSVIKMIEIGLTNMDFKQLNGQNKPTIHLDWILVRHHWNEKQTNIICCTRSWYLFK